MVPLLDQPGAQRGRTVRALFAILLAALLLAGAIAPPHAALAATASTDTVSNAPLAEYRGPSGMRIVSYSAKWTSQAQLQAVYDELLKNLHGAELSLLDAVELHAEPGSGAAGYWDGAFLTYSSSGPQMQPGRRIILYDMDRRSQVAEIAPALAHEYGHHFTYYYLAKAEGVLFDEWAGTTWARLRGLNDYPEVAGGSHRWDPAEIAANDYVLLFGSPTAHLVAYEGVMTYYPERGERVWDPAPRLQENLALPLAVERPGLRDYWLSAMGRTAEGLPALPPSSALRAGGLDRLGRVQMIWSAAVGAPAGSKYSLWWDNVPYPSARAAGVTYTGSGIPVDLGAANGSWNTKTDITDPFRNNATGWVRFYVVTLGSGMISRSNLVWLKRGTDGYWQFYAAEPYRSTPAAPMWDVFGHWAEKDILALYARRVVNGFPDGSYHPNDQLTRAQFTKLLVAALGKTPVAGTGGYAPLARLSSHWLAISGWLVPAVRAGIVLPEEWGPGIDIDAPIPRQEMARMAALALGWRPADPSGAAIFVDAAQIGPAFAGYVAAAYKGGILTGFPESGGKFSFHPLEGTTRAQGAVVISRVLAKLAVKP